MENKKPEEKKETKKVAEAEKELAKEIAETEEKLDKGKMTEKQAEKEINKEVKEEVEKLSKQMPGEKKETKKVAEAKKDKGGKKTGKKEAIVNGRDLPLSRKHCIAICSFIRGKKIEEAMNLLEQVNKMKIAVPMRGEIPHRKGKIMSGRYPVNANRYFIKLLKQLSANAVNNDIDIDKGVVECKANQANRPYKRFGSMKFKRTHVTLKLVIKNKLKKRKRK